MIRFQSISDLLDKFLSEGKPHIVLFPIKTNQFNQMIVEFDLNKSAKLSSNLDFIYPAKVLARTVTGKFIFKCYLILILKRKVR